MTREKQFEAVFCTKCPYYSEDTEWGCVLSDVCLEVKPTARKKSWGSNAREEKPLIKRKERNYVQCSKCGVSENHQIGFKTLFMFHFWSPFGAPLSPGLSSSYIWGHYGCKGVRKSPRCPSGPAWGPDALSKATSRDSSGFWLHRRTSECAVVRSPKVDTFILLRKLFPNESWVACFWVARLQRRRSEGTKRMTRNTSGRLMKTLRSHNCRSWEREGLGRGHFLNQLTDV